MPKSSLEKKPHSSSPRRNTRSSSPNNVLVNGQIIEKAPIESITISRDNSFMQKSNNLENILEENDPTVTEENLTVSLDDTSVDLEELVKKADENVQQFAKHATDLKNCKEDNQEVKAFANFLNAMDEDTKNKIVGSLIDSYKKEISDGATQDCKINIPNSSSDSVPASFNADKIKTVHFQNTEGRKQLREIRDNIKKSLQNQKQPSDIPQCFKEISGTASTNNDSLNLNQNFLVSYNTKSEFGKEDNLHRNDSNDSTFQPLILPDYLRTPILPEDSLSSREPLENQKLKKDADVDVREIYESLPVDINNSKEEAINRILGKSRKEDISKPKVYYKSDANNENKRKVPITFRSSNYEKIKKGFEDPPFAYGISYKSEGVQTCFRSLKKLLSSKNIARNLNILKAYKYHQGYQWESRSDIVMECPFGCHLNLKRSKSDTDLQQVEPENTTKKRGILTQIVSQPKKSLSFIKVDRKPSIQLLKENDIRRKRPLINYLDEGLHRGDSEFQMSQILFKRPVKNIDNDTSSVVIPALDQKQINHFNPNYLLHAVEIQPKGEIIPSGNISLQYFSTDPIISEADYKKWLKEQNLIRYTNNLAANEKSMGDLKSISEMVRQPASQQQDFCGTYGYYLDKDDSSTPQPSTVEQASNFFADLSEVVLYEHVVLTRAINFFCSINAKRIKQLKFVDRLVQVMFFALFYGLWIFFSRVFAEREHSSRRLVWK